MSSDAKHTHVDDTTTENPANDAPAETDATAITSTDDSVTGSEDESAAAA